MYPLTNSDILPCALGLQAELGEPQQCRSSTVLVEYKYFCFYSGG